jgi:hypothetical protein
MKKILSVIALIAIWSANAVTPILALQSNPVNTVNNSSQELYDAKFNQDKDEKNKKKKSGSDEDKEALAESLRSDTNKDELEPCVDRLFRRITKFANTSVGEFGKFIVRRIANALPSGNISVYGK